jgi:hypothetical protein
LRRGRGNTHRLGKARLGFESRSPGRQGEEEEKRRRRRKRKKRRWTRRRRKNALPCRGVFYFPSKTPA